MEGKVIAIGYINTIVSRTTGSPDGIGGIKVLKKLSDAGHIITNLESNYWRDLKGLCIANDITFNQFLIPHAIISDKCVGCPLISNPNISDVPYVDWSEMLEILKIYEIL